MSTTRIALLGALAMVAAGCETAPRATAAEVGPVEHIQVHEVPGQTKQQLCTSARDWAALTFRDSKAVVEVFDAEQGRLIGKGRAAVPFMATTITVDFTLVVECRDGRARASYTNLQSFYNGLPTPVAQSPSATFRGNSLAEMRRIDGLLANYLRNPRVGGQW